MTADTETETLTQARKEFLHSVFVTALEGGIGYWSLASEYRWSDGEGNDDLDGFHAVIHEITDDEDAPGVIHKPDPWGILDGDYYKAEPIRIDAEVIERGIARFIKWCLGVIDHRGNLVPLDEQKPNVPADSYYWQFVLSSMTDGDQGDYDSIVADMVVQFAVFGEVVYG